MFLFFVDSLELIFFGLLQIEHHFREFSSTNMIIEKLKKIVTCPVEASFKAK
jgi:hypothetical protein